MVDGHAFRIRQDFRSWFVFRRWQDLHSVWHLANSLASFLLPHEKLMVETLVAGSMWSISRSSVDPHFTQNLSAKYSLRLVATHSRWY